MCMRVFGPVMPELDFTEFCSPDFPRSGVFHGSRIKTFKGLPFRSKTAPPLTARCLAIRAQYFEARGQFPSLRPIRQVILEQPMSVRGDSAGCETQ